MTRSHPIHLDQARQTAAIIPPNVLVHVLHSAHAHGIDSRGWFSGLGLNQQQLLEPHVKVSYRQARTILLRAMKAFEKPGLGLIVGSNEHLGAFGLLGLLMMTSATFGQAMRLGIENHRVSGSLLDMRFEQLPGDQVALTLWPRFDDPQLQPFLCEEIIASALMIARELIGERFKLCGVELTYAAPDYAQLYEKVLGAPVRFGAHYNRAVLDAHWLDTPLPGHNPLAARQALELCKTQLSQSRYSEHEIVATVERVLRERLEQQPRIGEVARLLNLSERSLRRQLAAAGRAFREIHDEVRTERALELLRGSAMPVMDVAAAVGFSDAREFRRAFRRWTGISPLDARKGRTRTHVGRFAPHE